MILASLVAIGTLVVEIIMVSVFHVISKDCITKG